MHRGQTGDGPGIEELRFTGDAHQVVVREREAISELGLDDQQTITQRYLQCTTNKLAVEKDWTRAVVVLEAQRRSIHKKLHKLVSRTPLSWDEITHNFYLMRPWEEPEDHICIDEFNLDKVTVEFFEDATKLFQSLPPVYRNKLTLRARQSSVDTVEDLLLMTVRAAAFLGPIEEGTRIAQRFTDATDHIKTTIKRLKLAYSASKMQV